MCACDGIDWNQNTMQDYTFFCMGLGQRRFVVIGGWCYWWWWLLCWWSLFTKKIASARRNCCSPQRVIRIGFVFNVFAGASLLLLVGWLAGWGLIWLFVVAWVWPVCQTGLELGRLEFCLDISVWCPPPSCPWCSARPSIGCKLTTLSAID